jgi:REP element-mobilizing transposase RayT
MNQGRIWQREYWDRFVRNERHYWDVKAYIENNPVKANLVKVPEKWPWSSAAVQKNVYSPW